MDERTLAPPGDRTCDPTADRPESSPFPQRLSGARGRLDDVPNGFARGNGPHQQPLEIVVLDRVASGASTPAALAEATGADPASVEAALTWAVGQGFLTRMSLRDGDYLTLTESGLASVAWQRRLLTVIGEDGEIDLAGLSRDYGAAHQAMQAGRYAALARSQAHLLADDAEREAAAARLGEHFAQGAFDRAELERRTALVLSARTRGDLHAALESLEPDPVTPAPMGPLVITRTSLPTVDVAKAVQVMRMVGTLVFVVFLASFAIRVLSFLL